MAKNNTLKNLTATSNIENQNKIAYLFILPWLIGFTVFVVYPFFQTIYNTGFRLHLETCISFHN